MKKLLMIAMALCLTTSFASAETVTYGWEDGGTVLGLFGSGDPPIIATNVGAPDPVYAGDASLRLEDNSPSGTPQAYIAFIWGLVDGDVVDASFWRYDDSPDASPSVRIWGHWNDELPGNPDGYNGSAGGNGDYGLGEGWDLHSWSWTVVDGHTGLVVEARTYSEPGDTTWIDELTIIAPDQAYIQVPGQGPVSAESKTWGGIKSMYID